MDFVRLNRDHGNKSANFFLSLVTADEGGRGYHRVVDGSPVIEELVMVVES